MLLATFVTTEEECLDSIQVDHFLAFRSSRIAALCCRDFFAAAAAAAVNAYRVAVTRDPVKTHAQYRHHTWAEGVHLHGLLVY